jgi:hypothetical protein
MTFVVNHAGTVYQKDFGERTAIIAKRILLVRSWIRPGKKVDVATGKLKRCHLQFGSL